MTRLLRCWVLAAPLLAYAQLADVEVGAPTLGYALDGAGRQVYPIQGVPGSAILGSRVNLDAPVDRMWLSPNRRHGLAASGSSLLLLRLDGGTGAARALEGGQPEYAGFSPDGRSAAVVRGGSIEIWRGLPDQASLSRTLAAPEAGVSRVTVSDDGAVVAVLSQGRVVLVGNEPKLLSEEADFVDLCFAGNSHTLLALGSGRLVSWTKAGEASGYAVIAEELGNATAMSLSADETTLAILGSGRLTLVDRDSGRTGSIELAGFEAEGLWRASGNAVFQMHRGASGRIWMVDADSGAPRLFSAAGRDKE